MLVPPEGRMREHLLQKALEATRVVMKIIAKESARARPKLALRFALGRMGISRGAGRQGRYYDPNGLKRNLITNPDLRNAFD